MGHKWSQGPYCAANGLRMEQEIESQKPKVGSVFRLSGLAPAINRGLFPLLRLFKTALDPSALGGRNATTSSFSVQI